MNISAVIDINTQGYDDPVSEPSGKTPRGFRISELVRKIFLAIEVLLAVVIALSALSICLFPLPAAPLILMITGIVLGVLLICEAALYYSNQLPGCLQEMVHLISSTVGEFFSILASVCLYGFKMTKKNSKIEELKGNKPLIIFAHGFMHNSSGGWYIRHRVRQEGYSLVSLNQEGILGKIENYGDQIVALAEKYTDYIEKHGVILLGHSMGGMASIDAACKLVEKKWKMRLITCGSPLNGTYAAKIGYGKSARQMDYPSDFSKQRLENLAKVPQISCSHIGSSHDGIIRPVNSAIAEKPEDESHVMLAGIGHCQLLFSDATIDVLMKQMVV